MDSKTALAMVLALLLSLALVRVLSAVDIPEVLAEAIAGRHEPRR